MKKYFSLTILVASLFMTSFALAQSPVMSMRTNVPAPACRYVSCEINNLLVDSFTLDELDHLTEPCNNSNDNEVILDANQFWVCDESINDWVQMGGIFSQETNTESGDQVMSIYPSSSGSPSVDRFRLQIGTDTTGMDADDKLSALVVQNHEPTDTKRVSMTLRQTASNDSRYIISAEDVINGAGGTQFHNSFSIDGCEEGAGTCTLNTLLIGTRQGNIIFPDDVSALSPVSGAQAGGRVQIQQQTPMIDNSGGSYDIDAGVAALTLVRNADDAFMGTGLVISADSSSYPTAAIVAKRTGPGGQGTMIFYTNDGSGAADEILEGSQKIMILEDDKQVGIGTNAVDTVPFAPPSGIASQLEVNGNITLTPDGSGNAQYFVQGVADAAVGDPDHYAASKGYVDNAISSNISGGCFNGFYSGQCNADNTENRCVSSAVGWGCLAPSVAYDTPGSGFVSAYAVDGVLDAVEPSTEACVCISGCCMP